ncbi:helix-turn-helix domain-containing protein [Bradyrhizobium sp. SZCCHNPS2010]|uniref:helix-turn-helix domain-containing protein n=1 Tax=Bradyrhizobium sp. SZCCHNPS2010 TaxID=3057333 RepID=UPI0029167DE4|nr:helix-turn-helix domain-containing protein [Bradyrhizobium sp. SZCCHNPS2010]
METDIFPQTGIRHSLRERWGFVIDPGFLALPYVVLLHQAELGLSSECLNVLLNFLAHWHAEGRMAYPHTNTIAKRMGISPRSVQRAVSWLTKEGFMAKVPKRNSRDRQSYDLTPLVEKLKPYAWARIQLMQERRREEVLSDELLIELSRPPRPTGAEMFGEAIRQGIPVAGYPAPVPVKNEQ